MFDIDISKILLIVGLALVVLGPDKLPGVARTLGRWAGRARSMARQFRDQLETEADNLNFKVDLNAAPAATARATPPAAPAAPTAPAAPAATPAAPAAPRMTVPTDAAAAPHASGSPAPAAAPVPDEDALRAQATSPAVMHANGPPAGGHS